MSAYKEKMLSRHLKEITTDRYVIEMNMPTDYPKIEARSTEEGGVRDRLFKSVAELPDEITDYIADETITSDCEELLNWLTEKGHPVLGMEPLM